VLIGEDKAMGKIYAGSIAESFNKVVKSRK